MKVVKQVRARAGREYWENLKPGTGRPYSAALSKPEQWGVTAGQSRFSDLVLTGFLVFIRSSTLDEVT